MSDQEDFLSRWSRRKRAVADDRVPSTPPQPAQPVAAAPSVEQRDVGARAEEPAFDPASLPPIESITAETDIRAFLASAVPADVKRDALRRAWSVDPAIRDFIGLSENSGDFNTPGAMAGFGPLEMTEDLRRMVAALFTPAPERSTPDAAVHHAEGISDQPTPKIPESVQTAATVQDETLQNKEENSTVDGLPQQRTNVVAAQKQTTEPAELPSTTRPTGRRCHGGALPK